MKLKQALILLGAGTLIANAPVMPDEYTLLCEGTQATGFNWRNGDFVEARFNPERYIVTKKETNVCYNMEKRNEVQNIGDLFQIRNVCLNFRKFGTEYSPILSQPCVEYYIKDDTGPSEKSFSCEAGLTGNTIEGYFDGLFSRFSNTNLRPNPRNDYRDSILVEVGKCSIIG